MKTCFKCGQTKPLELFYTHAQMADGRLNKCIECTKKDAKARFLEKRNDEEFMEAERVRSREKYHRLMYREKHKPDPERKKAWMTAYKERYPEKAAARTKVKESIPGMQRHHWSYRPEHTNDIVFLTEKEHYTLHRHIRYDKDTMMYRTLSGILLDTKEKHVEYANEVLNKLPN